MRNIVNYNKTTIVYLKDLPRFNYNFLSLNQYTSLILIECFKNFNSTFATIHIYIFINCVYFRFCTCFTVSYESRNGKMFFIQTTNKQTCSGQYCTFVPSVLKYFWEQGHNIMKVFVRFYYIRMSVNIKRTTITAKPVHFANVFPNILAMHTFCWKIKSFVIFIVKTKQHDHIDITNYKKQL